MKHPFQIVLSNKEGTLLFTSAQNQIQVFSTVSGQRIGSFIDIFDPKELIKEKIDKEQARKNAEKEANNGADTTVEEPSKKKQKTEAKVPTPGAGAPKIFNFIRALHLTSDEHYLIAATDSDKAAAIFEIDVSNTENVLKLIKRQRFPKRPSAISSSIDNKDVLLGDKFGDVYAIPIDSNATDEKNSETDPLLGHVSMLTDVTVAEHNGKQYVISADRDEHIRISNYPNGFVIENFLFGHSEFISKIVVPSFAPTTLVSAGGDDSVFFWNWSEGKLISKFSIKEIIAPYLTNAHLALTKFQNETNDAKEFSVSHVVPIESTNSIAVVVEQTKVVLIIKLDPVPTLHKIVELPANIVSLTTSKQSLIASLDNDSELLQVIDISTLTLVHPTSIETIAESSQAVSDSRDDFFPLFTIGSLRKRSEY